MRLSAAFVATAGLLACTSDTTTDDTGITVPAVCDATLLEALPLDGEDVIGTNASIVLFTEGNVLEGGAAVHFEEDPGVTYTATIHDDRVVFSPDAALAADTTYTWTADLCDAVGVAGGSFTTRGEGEAVEDPTVLVDRTFSLDLVNATWIEPTGLGGDLVASFFAGVFLIGVQDVTDTELDTIMAVGEDIGGGQVQQDPCYETIDFDPADFTRNPYFELEASRMPLEVQGQSVMLDGVRIFGALVDDGTDLTDAELKGDADLRQLGPTWEDYCAYGESFGVSCQACDSDGEEACVKLHVAEIDGVVQAGLVVSEVLDADAECGNDTDKETDTSGGGA